MMLTSRILRFTFNCPRSKKCKFFLLFVTLVLGCFWKRHLIRVGIHNARLILHLMTIDSERKAEDISLVAQNQWRLYQLQSKYMVEFCKSRPDGLKREGFLWLTALVNDEYAVPAVVLGHSIRTLSCVKNMVALVSEGVSETARVALGKVGWSIKEVEAMDCTWMDRRLGQQTPETPRQRIRGTHTKFHAWKYINYTKIIYADPDYMLLNNIDELFEIHQEFGASFASRPGILDFRFNAGLLVIKPDINEYKSIMALWEEWASERKSTDVLSDSCWDDQTVLNYYYLFSGKWRMLSHTYNSLHVVYHPMKAFHFICCTPQKPWRDRHRCRPSRDEVEHYDQPITNVQRASLVFWKILYKALKVYDIGLWWEETPWFDRDMEYGQDSYRQCWTE